VAKTARIFAAIDVHYFEDDRVLDAGDAWQLHLAAILACKRNLSNGQLTRRQVARIAPESVPDIASAIDTLIRVGLFLDRGESIEVHGWGEWNDSREDVEAMSKGGKKGNHLRWHAKKNVTDPECEFCSDQVSSPGESGGDRVPNPREETDVDPDSRTPYIGRPTLL
jgi:hypothetical protein